MTLPSLALAACLAGTGASPGDGLPRVLARENGVKDPVFAILFGLLSGDHHGTLTRPRLEAALGGDLRRSRLPYRRLRELTREAAPPGRPARVVLRFEVDLDEPIPYSILGYHPGRFATSAESRFLEWRMGDYVPGSGAAPLEDVRLFVLVSGRIRVDIAGWLDFLAGSALDDTEVNALAVARRGGRFVGIAVGHGKGGAPRSGSFDFAADRILFPSPAELKASARWLRGRLTALREEAQQPRAP
jgi:hypothetical protein